MRRISVRSFLYQETNSWQLPPPKTTLLRGSIHNLRGWWETNFGPTGHHCPQGSPRPRACTVSSASVIFKFILEVVFSEGGGKQKSRATGVGRGRQLCCFLSKIPRWKSKCETVRCCDETASSFDAKVWGEVFAHFHAVSVKCHSNMRNWLFEMPGWITLEQSPRCQRKWWACSWLCSSPVLLFQSALNWAWHSNTRVRLTFPSPNACLVSPSHSFQDLHKRYSVPWNHKKEVKTS
jgi:hypothetical protein